MGEGVGVDFEFFNFFLIFYIFFVFSHGPHGPMGPHIKLPRGGARMRDDEREVGGTGGGNRNRYEQLSSEF